MLSAKKVNCIEFNCTFTYFDERRLFSSGEMIDLNEVGMKQVCVIIKATAWLCIVQQNCYDSRKEIKKIK